MSNSKKMESPQLPTIDNELAFPLIEQKISELIVELKFLAEIETPADKEFHRIVNNFNLGKYPLTPLRK